MNPLCRPALHVFRPGSAASLRLALLVGVLALSAFVCGRAAAQPVAADPPGRVARLAELSGSAWSYHPDNGDWTEAVRNLPLTTGDRLATDPGSRAELQIGSTTIRLDGGSEVEIVALDDTRIALQLHAGALAARIRNAAEAGQVDVLTDDGRFLVLRAGSYRFDRGTRSSSVVVESGEVRYAYSTSALNVGAGQRGEFWIDAGGAAQYALLAPVADAFTAWNAERDRALDRGVAVRYASPEMTGVTDLDRFGTWEQTPDYGAVWYPTTVAVDWAPYSAGRWAWVRPWGWTWVDDAPWGFAPFHYGRWVNVRNRWCWTPGVRQPRPVWAPALVGWVGGGASPGGPRGGGGPAVGWFPLAPREVYVPGYASTPRYVRSINQTNVNNPALVNAAINDPRSVRDFENRRFPHAVTVVPATVLIERRPVGPAASQFRDAPWAREFAQRGGPGGGVLTAPPVAPPNFRSPGDARRPPRPPPGFAEQRGGRREAFAERDAARNGGPGPGGAPDPRFASPGDDRNRDGVPDRSPFPGGVRGPQGSDGDVSHQPRGTPNAARPQVPPIAPVVPQSPNPLPPMAPQPGLATLEPGRGFPQRPPPGDASQRNPMSNPREYRPPSDALQQPRPGMPNDDRRESVPNPPNSRLPAGAAMPSPPRAAMPGEQPRGAGPNPPEPLPADAQQQSPRMRVLPVRRGEDRRIGDDAGAPGMRPEAAPAARPQPTAPAPSVVPARPVEAPRPAERIAPVQPMQPVRPEVVAPRPPEPQSPRGPAPPAAPRQAPAESPRVGGPDRRNDPGASR